MIAIHSATTRRNRPRRGRTGGHDETQLERWLRRGRTGWRGARRAAFLVVLLLPTLVARPAAAEDAKAEAAAAQAIEKAGDDFSSKTFGKALYRLGKALRGCGKSLCADVTVAALVRDIGSIHVRQRDTKAATKFFARAIGLVPDLELNPTYDSPDVREVWEAAGGRKKPAPPPPAPPPPPTPVAFAHVPPAAQQVDTPLPIYVEGGPDTVAKAVAEYASPSGDAPPAWKDLALERIGSGWGGAVPCADVTEGSVRYFIAGFDSAGTKVATAGDPEHPYEVAIHATIASEPPHLPGQPAPKSCVQAPAPGGVAGEPRAPAAEEAPLAPKPKPPWRRLWVGVASDIDFMEVPSGDDLCVRNAATLRPTNGNNLYCTTLDGADFPPASVIHGTLGDIVPGRGQGGHSDGGLQLGDVRFMATVDYALTANALVGARVGFLIHQYQGHDASRDHRAFGTPLHAELRATWVFGHDPLAGTKVAPLVFVAGGISEFDAQVKSSVTVTQGTPPTQTSLSVPVNIWRTDGPGFIGVGAGLRIGIGGYAAIVPAVRGSIAFGDNGVVPVWGPELTLQIGF